MYGHDITSTCTVRAAQGAALIIDLHNTYYARTNAYYAGSMLSISSGACLLVVVDHIDIRQPRVRGGSSRRAQRVKRAFGVGWEIHVTNVKYDSLVPRHYAC